MEKTMQREEYGIFQVYGKCFRRIEDIPLTQGLGHQQKINSLLTYLHLNQARIQDHSGGPMALMEKTIFLFPSFGGSNIYLITNWALGQERLISQTIQTLLISAALNCFLLTRLFRVTLQYHIQAMDQELQYYIIPINFSIYSQVLEMLTAIPLPLILVLSSVSKSSLQVLKQVFLPIYLAKAMETIILSYGTVIELRNRMFPQARGQL